MKHDVSRILISGQGAAVVQLDASPSVLAQPIPILFLHGWGTSSELMTPIADRMTSLGFSAVVPDFPGFGQSDPPYAGWSVHDYTKWTITLLDTLKLSRVHLFAHSFGGRISLLLGSQYADRIDKIALTGAAGIPSKKSQSSQLRLSAYKGIRSGLQRFGASDLAADLSGWYNKRYGSADLQASNGVMRETFLKVVNEDLSPFATKVSRPTLLFWGDKDQDTPLWQGQTLEKLIPDAGLIVYEGGDHYAYLRRQVEIARTLDHFYRN